MVRPSERRRHRGVRGAGGRLAAAASGGGGTPLPHVTGPLPVTATSYPFGAADHTLVPEDLSKVGYVEEEYLVSGKANVYTWPGPGPAAVRTPDAPYTTRILVRRPAKASRFSGNVVVEMLNPSNLFDLNIGWALAHRQMVRNGDAWVGITDKPIDVVALKNFDPARYALAVVREPAGARRPGQLPNPVSSVDSTTASRATEDGLALDIYSQVGALVRSRDRANPLAYGGNRHDWRARGTVTAHAGRRSSTSTASATRRPAATCTTTSTPSTRSTSRATAATRSTTATSSPSPGRGFVGSVPINQCEDIPHPGRAAAAVLQRRRADHPRHVAVGLPVRPRPCAARTATRRPTATATTRWPAPPTPRRTS